MKDYLRALSALTRNYKFMGKGLEVDASTVRFYTEECRTHFLRVFGDTPGSAKVVKLLDAAIVAATNNDVKEYLRLIDEAHIMI